MTIVALRGTNADLRCKGNLQDLMRDSLEQRSQVQSLCMVAEPENRFDPNAIRVEMNQRIIGYIPKEINQLVHQQFSVLPTVPMSVYRWGVFKDNNNTDCFYCEVAIEGLEVALV